MALTWLSFILVISFSVHHLDATVFTVKNSCAQTIYAGTLSGSGPQLMNGGFELAPNAEQKLTAPAGWSGRFWGRSGCNFDPAGKGSCATGDCGGALKCSGAGGVPPASLAEFTLGSTDFYDVSLVDGFNIPISITPSSAACTAVKCVSDVNEQCPPELRQTNGGAVVGCKSPCLVFGKPEYCCTGDFGRPESCKPTNYSRVFKSACPQAYSYAYDDKSSTFTCTGGVDYTITFC